jgi:hypothetical protein
MQEVDLTVDDLAQLADRDENDGSTRERALVIAARAELALRTARNEIPKPRRTEGLFTLRELEALADPESVPLHLRGAA